jgi:Rrf2 family protein
MLSQTVEYALRAVVFLADGAPQARTTRQIAETTRVPSAYLSKVLQSLVRAGIVRSRRGLGGGMTLSRPPAELTILDVITAVEPLGRIRTCPLELAAHGVRLCPLHRRLDDALAMVEQAFGETTLAEILAEPSRSVPLCGFPSPQHKAAKGTGTKAAAAKKRPRTTV